MTRPGLTSERYFVEGDIGAVFEYFYRQGWTDGLPIIPPTPSAVQQMLTGIEQGPQEVVGRIPPKWADATVEKIAINAVMAGCLPEYMPVIVTALEVMCQEQFNLYGLQATTAPSAPLLIVNGPIRKRLDLNGGYGAFGPGWRANATIGRAIRLILLNIGGSIPGVIRRATQAQPSFYTYCIAENEEQNPWEPLHVERGFPKETSTLTVLSGENPHNINERSATTGEGILLAFAYSLGAPYSNNAVFSGGAPALAINPEHSAMIARDGFSKAAAKQFIQRHARISLKHFAPETAQWRRQMAQDHGETIFEDDTLPLFQRWEDLTIIVVGGAGRHSSRIMGGGMGPKATKAIPGAYGGS